MGATALLSPGKMPTAIPESPTAATNVTIAKPTSPSNGFESSARTELLLSDVT
jgi:hypothetical protein